MIGYLRGVIIEKSANSVILDVSGVGYAVEVPMSTLCALPPEGNEAALMTHTHVREDAIRLFGFASVFDRKVFEALVSVSSVGPKSALNLLGPLNGLELCDVIISGDLKGLTSIPGVGAKTAERLILELKTKLQKLVAGDHDSGAVTRKGASASVGTLEKTQRRVLEDLRSALENLGYKDKQIDDAMASFEAQAKSGETLVLETALRDVLKKLSGRVVSTL